MKRPYNRYREPPSSPKSSCKSKIKKQYSLFILTIFLGMLYMYTMSSLDNQFELDVNSNNNNNGNNGHGGVHVNVNDVNVEVDNTKVTKTYVENKNISWEDDENDYIDDDGALAATDDDVNYDAITTDDTVAADNNDGNFGRTNDDNAGDENVDDDDNNNDEQDEDQNQEDEDEEDDKMSNVDTDGQSDNEVKEDENDDEDDTEDESNGEEDNDNMSNVDTDGQSDYEVKEDENDDGDDTEDENRGGDEQGTEEDEQDDEGEDSTSIQSKVIDDGTTDTTETTEVNNSEDDEENSNMIASPSTTLLNMCESSPFASTLNKSFEELIQIMISRTKSVQNTITTSATLSLGANDSGKVTIENANDKNINSITRIETSEEDKLRRLATEDGDDDEEEAEGGDDKKEEGVVEGDDDDDEEEAEGGDDKEEEVVVEGDDDEEEVVGDNDNEEEVSVEGDVDGDVQEGEEVVEGDENEEAEDVEEVIEDDDENEEEEDDENDLNVDNNSISLAVKDDKNDTEAIITVDSVHIHEIEEYNQTINETLNITCTSTTTFSSLPGICGVDKHMSSSEDDNVDCNYMIALSKSIDNENERINKLLQETKCNIFVTKLCAANEINIDFSSSEEQNDRLKIFNSSCIETAVTEIDDSDKSIDRRSLEAKVDSNLPPIDLLYVEINEESRSNKFLYSFVKKPMLNLRTLDSLSDSTMEILTPMQVVFNNVIDVVNEREELQTLAVLNGFVIVDVIDARKSRSLTFLRFQCEPSEMEDAP